jgi:uncharacterized protein DUF4253
MQITTHRIKGAEAIQLLNEHRSRYSATGFYPFLIGDGSELENVTEAAELNDQDPAAIIRASLETNTAEWIAQRRKRAVEEDEISLDDKLGKWPGEISDKGSIGLHKDVLSGTIKPEIYLGLAKIEEPWHLPAILKYGAWNECPESEVHCAFHRHWQLRYGAEITGMSGDVVECLVRKPPVDRETSMQLAWEQFWYCPDTVDQGCGSVSALAATLMNAPYWYFWWD